MAESPRIAFATCAEYSEGSQDDRLALSGLRQSGLDAAPAIWNRPGIRWEEFSLIVVRSTWDYPDHVREFLGWLDTVDAAPLWNPASLQRWNLNKSYLSDLAARGFDVVPTHVVPQDRPTSLGEVMERTGWDEVVVKPCVGLAGRGLRRVDRRELAAGEQHLRALLHEGDVLVQPYQRAVESLGERSLVFLDGEFSHAVASPAVMTKWEKQAHPCEPGGRELAEARRLVAHLRPEPLYARVDLLPDGQGRWRLGELELIEPELFFRFAPHAVARLVRGVRRRLDPGGG